MDFLSLDVNKNVEIFYMSDFFKFDKDMLLKFFEEGDDISNEISQDLVTDETINNIRNDVNHEITTISKQKKIHEKSLTWRLFFCTYELSTLSSADISKSKSVNVKKSKSKSKSVNVKKSKSKSKN